MKERNHLAKANVIVQLNEIRTHSVYQSLSNLRAQMADRASAAQSMTRMNFLLNAGGPVAMDQHAALRAASGMPAVTVPTAEQIANMVAGRQPDGNGVTLAAAAEV